MSAAGYDPQGAVELQETFVKLSEDGRSDWLSGLFASHPASAERLAKNRATAEKLPKEGELGQEVYSQKGVSLLIFGIGYGKWRYIGTSVPAKDIELPEE